MRAESVMCNDSNDNKTTHDRCVTPVNYADVGLMYGQIMTPVSRHSRVLASAWPLINFISSQYFCDTKYFPRVLLSSVRRVSAACDGDGLTVTNVCHYLVNYF